MADPGLAGFLLLAAAGLLAGAVNAIAGGGSLISFPALLAVGYPSVTANVTNQVAVLPGYAGGSIGYRRELRGQGSRSAWLSVTSVLGAVLGAALLVAAPPSVFEWVVPFLVFFACALLAAQPWISRRVRPVEGRRGGGVRLHAMQFAGSVYGGYFGAGLGIMLLAVLALGVDDTLQRLNALKGLLSLVVGAASVAFFVVVTPIAWTAALVMAGASFVGGQAGVVVARRLSAELLRVAIVAFGVLVGVWLLVA